jgi:hypothetical protein
MVQMKDNLFAAWKLLISFRKEGWELRDYPVLYAPGILHLIWLERLLSSDSSPAGTSPT